MQNSRRVWSIGSRARKPRESEARRIAPKRSESRASSAQPRKHLPPTLVSKDSISERQSSSEEAKAETAPDALSASAAIPDCGPAMMTAIPGDGPNALPGPLGQKHFAGEIEGDFEDALSKVEPGGPAGRLRARRSIWSSLLSLARLDRLRGPAMRADRHVAFDGYSNPMHDEKIERDR